MVENILREKKSLGMVGHLLVNLLLLSQTVPLALATCGFDMPQQPQPGQSYTSSIMVNDPNLGEVERSFVLHLPAGYSSTNDVETPLVLDFHGWFGDGNSQEYEGGLNDVADEDTDGGFIVVHGNGYGDPSAILPNWGSWNCSKTDGPMGPPCVLPRPEDQPVHCYDSCEKCDPMNSCDWTACYDDVLFVRGIVHFVQENYCLDDKSIHVTGISNGGQFSYYVASRLNDIIASIAPNAASPMIGFGDVPLSPPISVIDFHGVLDTVIPYDVNSVGSYGSGPHDSVISFDYYYYEQKPDTFSKWANTMSCQSFDDYPTNMDGINGWSCKIWSNCVNGEEVVHCNGLYNHNYPFEAQDYIGGTRLMWEFMKTHRKGS